MVDIGVRRHRLPVWQLIWLRASSHIDHGHLGQLMWERMKNGVCEGDFN